MFRRFLVLTNNQHSLQVSARGLNPGTQLVLKFEKKWFQSVMVASLHERGKEYFVSAPGCWTYLSGKPVNLPYVLGGDILPFRVGMPEEEASLLSRGKGVPSEAGGGDPTPPVSYVPLLGDAEQLESCMTGSECHTIV